ncbi:MAG: carbonic anhydrase [Parachlamydiaceae bacterium]
MRKCLWILASLLICSSVEAQEDRISSENALQRLMQGNERYAQDKLLHPDRTRFRREELTASQTPFAIILGCSDSRVSPEIVFDQGIGDLFVVRIAGNVVGPVELDSIEFAAGYLGSSIVFVLGHENCGAVSSVLNQHTKDIEAIAQLLSPSIQGIDPNGKQALEEAIKKNVSFVTKQLKQSPVLARLIEEKKIDVVGGYYHLGSGKVELIQ